MQAISLIVLLGFSRRVRTVKEVFIAKKDSR